MILVVAVVSRKAELWLNYNTSNTITNQTVPCKVLYNLELHEKTILLLFSKMYIQGLKFEGVEIFFGIHFLVSFVLFKEA